MIRPVTAPLLRGILWVVPLAALLAACNSTDPAMHSLSVSTTTKPPTPTGSPSGASGGALTFSAAQVVLSKIELAPVGTTCAAETEHDDAIRMSSTALQADDEHEADDEQEDNDESCEELKVGPLTVNLPLDASTQVVLDALVPAGTYAGVKAKLDAVTVSGVYTDTAGLAHPFTFKSIGHAEVEVEFPTPVTVGPATSNVTITVDVASWFRNASGAALDPTDPANVATISRNIRRSFRAFGDDDHDGVDDDHEDEDAH
jgi:hypothetical protein